MLKFNSFRGVLAKLIRSIDRNLRNKSKQINIYFMKSVINNGQKIMNMKNNGYRVELNQILQKKIFFDYSKSVA